MVIKKKHTCGKKKIIDHLFLGKKELCAYILDNKCLKNNAVIEAIKISRKVSDTVLSFDSKTLGEIFNGKKNLKYEKCASFSLPKNRHQ